MSSTPQTVTIYDNSGNTVLWDSETEGVYLPYTIYLVVDDGSYSVQFYDLEPNQLGATQSFDYTSLGFATSAGSSTVDYPFNGEPVEVDLTEEGLSLYLVEQSTPSPVNYRPLSYVDAKIQVDSAIRDANGVRIDTNYQKKPQVIEYTVPTTVSAYTTRTIAEYNGTYDGTPGHVKFIMEITSSSNKGVYVIEATWGQITGGLTLLSGSGASSDVYYVYLYSPSSTSNYAYPPLLSVYNYSTREKQVKITVLESSGNLTWKTDWNTTASSTGRTNQSVTLVYRSEVNRASSASSASMSDRSTYTYQTKNRTFRVGEYDYYKVMAIDHTGVAYKINTSTKKFPLPITMYYGLGSSANTTANSSQLTSGFGNYVSSLTSSSYNGFTLPTLTANDGGKILYVRGSLDADGYFVCDGHVTLSMEAGYTYIPFGTLDPYYISSTAQVPTGFSFNSISTPAYTLDSNGRLTHIDGKPISNGITVSSSAPSGGSDGDIWIQY